MKLRNYNIFAALFLIGILIGSCKKDEEINDPAGGPGLMTAKIEGRNFSSVAEASYSDGLLTIAGKNENEHIYIMLLNPNGETGKIKFNIIQSSDSGSYVSFFDDPQDPEIYYSWLGNNDGEVNITQLTQDRVKGTFHFAAASMDNGEIVTITEGTFDGLNDVLN